MADEGYHMYVVVVAAALMDSPGNAAVNKTQY